MSESSAPIRPVVSVAINPRTNDARQSLLQALSRIVQQDSTIGINAESLVGQVVIGGMSELHLKSVCDRLLHEYKIDAEIGAPEIIYLETIRKKSEAEGKFITQMGGCGQYGHVKLRVAPNEHTKGFEFEDATNGNLVPKEYIKPIEMGIKAAMEGGVFAGYPMVDVKAQLYDGSYHEVDSNELAYAVAASISFKEAARKASPVVLEPVMSVEVVVQNEYMGAIIADLNNRRGRIDAIEHRAGSVIIKSMVPLAEMLGYATDMRSITQGSPATFSIRFSRYEEAPYRGESGGDEAGITVNKPTGPNPRRGFAAAKPDSDVDCF